MLPHVQPFDDVRTTTTTWNAFERVLRRRRIPSTSRVQRCSRPQAQIWSHLPPLTSRFPPPRLSWVPCPGLWSCSIRNPSCCVDQLYSGVAGLPSVITARRRLHGATLPRSADNLYTRTTARSSERPQLARSAGKGTIEWGGGGGVHERQVYVNAELKLRRPVRRKQATVTSQQPYKFHCQSAIGQYRQTGLLLRGNIDHLGTARRRLPSSA